jgi:hypothetical protein
MQTFLPCDAMVFATYSTSGVLPVPPVVMLPMLITGRSSLVV